MIDVALTKENALPSDMWGLLSLSWKPAPEDGVTVFLQGLDKRGPDNRRKRIYMSAVTPDLYQGMYQAKIVGFFDQLFSAQNASKPLMRIYLDTFWDLYWDLHLGVKGQDIPAASPADRRKLQHRTGLPRPHPEDRLRQLHGRPQESGLPEVLDRRPADGHPIRQDPEPEKTFAWYWLKNGEESEYFNHQDVVFECFHNFVAFSQWGNTLYNIMAKLGRDTGDAQAKDWFAKTMAADYDNPDGSAFPPLERFVMELFRTISPNAGSISAMTETRPPAFERHGFIVSPHPSTSHDPVQWPNPDDFDPSRYVNAPTSADIDEARCQEMGLAKCPFDQTSSMSRTAARLPCETAVSALCSPSPTTIRCPCVTTPASRRSGSATGDARRTAHHHGLRGSASKSCEGPLQFVKVAGDTAEQLPIGPNTVIGDDIGFRYR